jgi:hypothetical protein
VTVNYKEVAPTALPKTEKRKSGFAIDGSQPRLLTSLAVGHIIDA